MRVARSRHLGELRLQRREPREDRLDGGVLLGIEPGQLLGDLRKGVLRRRVEPAPACASSRAAKPSSAALRIARSRQLGELRLQRREPGEDRLDGRVLLGIEPGQLLGDLRKGVLHRRVEPRLHAPRAAPAKPSSAALGRRSRASSSASSRLQRRQPREDRLGRARPSGRRAGSAARRSPQRGSPPASSSRACMRLAAARRSRRAPPCGSRAASSSAEPRLQRREPGEDRLDGGVLLGVEPGELPEISAKGFSAGASSRDCRRLEPRREAVERRLAGRGVCRARRAWPPAARAGRRPSRRWCPSGHRAG